LIAVHFGHPHIAQQDVELLLFQQRERGTGTIHGHTLRAVVAQYADDQVASIGFVVVLQVCMQEAAASCARGRG
jgi:hypothetical protein